jgi:hypothetical protein
MLTDIVTFQMIRKEILRGKESLLLHKLLHNNKTWNTNAIVPDTYILIWVRVM